MAQKKIKSEDIRKSLLEQLNAKGLTGNVYIDLINDYMALWAVKTNLINDIAKRGVTVEYKNGKNQWGTKQNDSVNNLLRTNAQMLKILSELGLRGADNEGDIYEEL